MGCEFSPMDKIQNIIYAIRELEDIWKSADSRMQDVYRDAIIDLLAKLNRTLDEIKINGEQ